ncbi:hypothetical protein C5167_039145 [Papaver somniferum]|uniref:Uncharacterized protein n=1 Tax=Papaver somniferum TaxID=3469 RepID=A0A4Y7IDT1_PAPSO|nr:homeobox protein knotted-1-like LET6 [Papaver somniferum]RZC46196.1 hypothetical protein C5167_039145 [Papaver somniferum]
MEGSGGGNSSDHHGATAASLMSFRGNNVSTGGGGGGGGGSSNGLSSMLMVMAPPPHHHPQPNSSEMVNNLNTLFLPLSSNNNNQNLGSSYHHHLQMYGDHDNDKHAAAGYYFMMKHNNIDKQHDNTSSSSFKRAKIMAHPHYLRLLTAYINCQKIGAPAEVVKKLEEIFASEESRMSSSSSRGGLGSLGEDPGLDQFMEAYCEMLSKYEQELTKPFKEAMIFISNIEAQLKNLTISTSSDHHSGRNNESSEEDFDASENFIDPQADDKELKIQLLRKYSGYLGSLKQEFLKKRKKGKLPKDARQQLMDWWTRYYKWPYPSEMQKLALAESTGLDQKQINNWFINQRKRHWKPSEDMQFVVMDAAHMHPSHQYYIDNLLTPNPFSIDYSCAPSSLM